MIWRKLWERTVAFVRLWIDLFSRHQIRNKASAISFQTPKALVPLALFGIALLKMFGLADVWTNTLASGISRQLTPTAFTAIETAVVKILSDGSPDCPFFRARRSSGTAPGSCAPA